MVVVGEHLDQAINEMLTDELRLEFVKSAIYEPLLESRNRDFFAALNEEIEFSHSDEVRNEDIIKLGENLGAQYMCIVRVLYSPTLKTNQVTAQMYDIKTRALVSMERHRSPLTVEWHITETATTLAKALSAKPPKEAAIDKKAAEDEANRRAQVKKDMELYGYVEFGKLYVQRKTSANNVQWSVANNSICKSKDGYNFRLPTLDELMLLYDYRSSVFDNSYFFDYIEVWSSNTCKTRDGQTGHLAVGKDKAIICFKPAEAVRCLCVRSK